MSTALTSQEFNEGRCPSCNRKGIWNTHERRLECRFCGIAGFGKLPVVNRRRVKKMVEHDSIYFIPDLKSPEALLDIRWIRFHRHRCRPLVADERIQPRPVAPYDVIADAEAVARAQFESPLLPDKTYTRQDLDDELGASLAFLATK